MNIDKKIEEALKDNDILKIMNKASNSFFKQLDQDEIYTCQLNALWNGFRNFNPNMNTKFTTYLYNGVYIECLKQLKFKNKSKKCNKKLHDNMSFRENNILFEILDCLNTDEEKDLIMDKYSNMTINEMAEKRNYSRETVRKKLKKIYQKLNDKTV